MTAPAKLVQPIERRGGELPLELTPRAPHAKPAKLGAMLQLPNLSIDVAQLRRDQAARDRATSPAGKLARLQHELESLLMRQAPQTWEFSRRRLGALFRAAHHEITDVDREEQRETIAAPTRSHEPARRTIVRGRGVR